MRMPFSMWNESSMYGSLISPFQPTVVRGFSKYTRITSEHRVARRVAPAAPRRCGVFARGVEVVDRARTDHDEDARVARDRGSRRTAWRLRLTTASLDAHRDRKLALDSSGVGSSSLETTLMLWSRSLKVAVGPGHIDAPHRHINVRKLHAPENAPSPCQIRHAARSARAALVTDDAFDRLHVG